MVTLISTFLIGNPNVESYSVTDGIVRPDGIIPLEEVMKMTEHDPIWTARGKAIQAYAMLEQAMCRTLSSLSGMTFEAAATIFYKITSAGSRNAIIEKLMHKKFDSKFNLFWRPLLKEMRRIDGKRNEIVHWLSVANAALDQDSILIVGVCLVPPTFNENKTGAHPRLTVKNLNHFSSECDVFSRLCSTFNFATRADADPIESGPWLEIFSDH